VILSLPSVVVVSFELPAVRTLLSRHFLFPDTPPENTHHGLWDSISPTAMLQPPLGNHHFSLLRDPVLGRLMLTRAATPLLVEAGVPSAYRLQPSLGANQALGLKNPWAAAPPPLPGRGLSRFVLQKGPRSRSKIICPQPGQDTHAGQNFFHLSPGLKHTVRLLVPERRIEAC